MDSWCGYPVILPGESQRLLFSWVLDPVMHHNHFFFFFKNKKSTTRLKSSFVDILLIWRGNLSSFPPRLCPCVFWRIYTHTKKTFKKIKHTLEYLVNNIFYGHIILAAFQVTLLFSFFVTWHSCNISLPAQPPVISSFNTFQGKNQTAWRMATILALLSNLRWYVHMNMASSEKGWLKNGLS